ncbi:MAG: FAD-dependent oxidoreductase [bacterium]
MAKVVILGSGLTGLSTAYHFEQQGFFDFKIFEKEKSSGGLLRSFQQNGFTFDFTGHLLHIKTPEFYQFINNVAGIENFFSQNRKSFIFTNERFIPYPFQSNLYNLPKEMIFDCIKGYIKRNHNIKTPRNFYDWVLKYFGSGIGKHFFFPYNTKLLSYDLKKITPSWTGRFIPKIDLDIILQSALQEQDHSNIGYNSHFYYPKKNGIEFLIQKLENKIKNKIYKNHEAINIDLKNKIIYFENGHTEKFEKLISTIPLNILLKKLKEKSNSNLKKNHTNLLCNSVINFNLGFKTNHINDKHWIYYPEKKYPFYRIGFWQNICNNSAPPETCAIYGEISYLSQNKTEKLIDNSINKSLRVLNKSNEDIICKKILHLPHAYVIYNTWREKNLKHLHKKLNELNLYSVGRYGEWKYSSMEEAFFDGKNIAKTIFNLLKLYPEKKHPAFLISSNQKEKGLSN